MKNTKVVLTVVGLLLLGFLGGFFTHRQITLQRVQTVREIVQPRGFEKHLLHFLEPSPAQKEQLDPIIREYAEKMGEQMRTHRQERQAIIEELHEKIRPLLTDEQIEKLEDFSRRFRDRRERRHRSPKPPREGKRIQSDIEQ